MIPEKDIPITDALRKSGYSQEDKYFYDKEKEIIHPSPPKQVKKCPTCGNILVTSLFQGLNVQECSNCHGVFLESEQAHFIKNLLIERQNLSKGFF